MASATSWTAPVLGSPLHYTQTVPSPPDRPFLLSATVAFPDDCSEVVFTKVLLEHLLERMKWMGVRRIYWEYYGDMSRGYWATAIRRPAQGGVTGVNVPGIHPIKQTLLNFGEPPINVGARLARQLGLESAPERSMPLLSPTRPDTPPPSHWVVRAVEKLRAFPGLEESQIVLIPGRSGIRNCGCAPGKVTFPGAWMGLSSKLSSFGS